MSFWQHPLIKQIGPDQIDGVLRATPVTLSGKLIATCILTLTLWGHRPNAELATWFVFTLAGLAIVFFKWSKARHKTVSRVSKNAIIRLMATTGLLALPWSYATIEFLGSGQHHAELLLVACISGLAAAGSTLISRVYPAALLYLTLVTGPLILKSFWMGTSEYNMLGLMAVGFFVFQRISISHGAKRSLARSKAKRDLEEKIAEMRQTRKALQRFAMEDPLTKLPNRREFKNRLGAAINEAERQGTTVSLLICDLDHFKNINDISGHEAGDKMLKEVAKRLKTTIRDYDFVSRIGGDEFAIIAKHHKTPKETAEFTSRILTALESPVEINGRDVCPGLSVGISMYPLDASDVESIMSHADMALQRGKAQGRGNFHFFDRQLKSKFSTDEALEHELRRALAENELEMFYQPKVAIKSGRLEGFEALLRWRRPNGEIFAPARFFEVAEDRGLISYISDFVVQQTLADIKNWREQGLDCGRISINIHPTQIRDEHRMKRIIRDIDRSGIDPAKIFLEITEGCVIGRGAEDVPKLLEYLRNQGLRISLDDFGTGFASLSHLKDLPVDELKFDRSFISGLLNDAPTRAIIHSMVKLAKSLNIHTVAEGIETHEQHNVLLAIGCDTGQGYLYNRPLSHESASRLITENQGDIAHKQPKITRMVSPALETARVRSA